MFPWQHSDISSKICVEILDKRFSYTPRGLSACFFPPEVRMNFRWVLFHAAIDGALREGDNFTWNQTHWFLKDCTKKVVKLGHANIMWAHMKCHLGTIMQKCSEIVINVPASWGYENELVIQKHCTTSSGLHDLTLSLLRLVLLPGYYFLWQHLSRWGEQLWKDTDNWLLCILWTGSPYISSEWKAQKCEPRERINTESSVWFVCFHSDRNKKASGAIQPDLEVIFALMRIKEMWLN